MKTKLYALMLALSLALTLAACGSSGGNGEDGAPQKEINLTDFYNTLLEEQEWPVLMALEGEYLDALYPGLSDVATKQCLVNTAAISSAVGELALVEVENAEDAQAAADVFQARIDYQVGSDGNIGGAFYPASIQSWEEDSHIVSNGSYVMLAVGDAAEAAVDSFNELFA